MHGLILATTVLKLLTVTAVPADSHNDGPTALVRLAEDGPKVDVCAFLAQTVCVCSCAGASELKAYMAVSIL